MRLLILSAEIVATALWAVPAAVEVSIGSETARRAVATTKLFGKENLFQLGDLAERLQ